MASHIAASDTLTVATSRHRELCRLVGTAHIARDDDELVVLLLVSLVTGRSHRLVMARPRRADAGMVHGCHRNDTSLGLASAS